MSGSLALNSLGVAGLVAGEALQSIFLRAPRAIEFIIPDCVIEERHSDRLQITQHPVEVGSNISDHAFMLPVEVSLRYGFTNSILASIAAGAFDTTKAVYEQLQRLQKSRVPFQIVTGKRVYQNMLLTELEVSTDVRTENALMVEAHCQQVIIVSTSAATITPASAQSMPQQTGDAINTGQQQLIPVPGGAPAGVA